MTWGKPGVQCHLLPVYQEYREYGILLENFQVVVKKAWALGIVSPWLEIWIWPCDIEHFTKIQCSNF